MTNLQLISVFNIIYENSASRLEAEGALRPVQYGLKVHCTGLA